MTRIRRNSTILALVFIFFCGVLYSTNAAALDITVSILSPGNDDTFQLGETIYFSGEGTIATSEYKLTGDDLVWMSSLDGRIGIGTYFSTSSLSAGHHRITLIGDNQAVDYIEIDVTVPDSPPASPVTSGNYATYNMANNTLYIPYSPYPGISYWINMSIVSFTPLKLQITGIGENAYDPNRAYATFNFLTNTLSIPDYRDAGGNSYWFALQMTNATAPLQFELGPADLNH